MKAQWTLEGLRKPIGISTYTDNLIQKVEHHLEVLTDELSKTTTSGGPEGSPDGVWKGGSVDDEEGRWRSVECGARELVANSLRHSYFPKILGANGAEENE